MKDDPRLRRVVRRYPKQEQAAHSELSVTVQQILRVLGPRRRDPMFVNSYRLTGSQAKQLMGLSSIDAAYDHYLQTEVRTEHIESYYRAAPSPSAPPQRLPSSAGEVEHIRPWRGRAQWANFNPGPPPKSKL